MSKRINSAVACMECGTAAPRLSGLTTAEGRCPTEEEWTKSFLDEESLLASRADVDLNPVAAGIVHRPERAPVNGRGLQPLFLPATQLTASR